MLKKNNIYLPIILLLICLLTLTTISCKKKINVTFQKTNEENVNLEVKKGTKINPILIKQEGYYLEDWYSDKELTNRFDFNQPITKSITLYPKFNKLLYKVSINSHYDVLYPNVPEKIMDMLNFSFYLNNNDVFNLNDIVTKETGSDISYIFTSGSIFLKEIKYKDEIVFHNESEWTNDFTFTYTEDIELEFFYEDRLEAIDKEENDYLANLLANDKDLIQTESGLVYKIIEHGEGKAPTDNTDVIVDYKCTLKTNELVDEQSGVAFTPTQVIPGFYEMLLLMHEGDKAICYIPYRLGYGDKNVNNILRAYSMLIYEITLVDVSE